MGGERERGREGRGIGIFLLVRFICMFFLKGKREEMGLGLAV